ncbi:hypothetical protein FJTKL_04924 [Diaporthe vaccinii]|uniref:Uncharacterized protein n=1 Tax=Diaporthe vaccinii TaxID=105482 RepID=A0ABR4DRV4_9PEZI
MCLDTEQVTLLRQAIKGRSRTPPALRKDCAADTNTTERIFLDHGGVIAWAAYVVTKWAVIGRSHSSYKAKQKHLLALLDNQSVEDRQASAAQLAAAMEPEKAQIEEWIKAARKRETTRCRRRLKTSSIGAEADKSEGDSGQRDPHECRNTPTSCIPSPPPTSNEPTHHTSDSISHSQHDNISHPSQQNVSHPCDRSLSSDDHIFVNASITACNRLFPEDLARAISKVDRTSVAAVSITFPHKSDSNALLSIDVTPDKIPDLAWELFSMRLESEDGFWYAGMVAQVVPTPNLGLRHCRIQPITLIFGDFLASAICANPEYQRERLKDNGCTNCISMIVPLAADDCAKICISLHPREGTQVKEILFQSA